ncbi:ralBP1-associated Eps domain-containing protein 1 isoform X2 [Teleopsis dalmanni]|uniref:ralBP1-associated Eps domain-containing protein 1 isoform X2 n=1 Tax=Teleopsis dalmanni TaxID=139649 RepID=UPI0018CE4771|nr:ralBP1-associated Eps domain-containing protein 1 isoform X2 [Teleopsis dalmanni]
MEEVSLTETETRYYSDLFLCCDIEKTGKIPMLKAAELYHSANLPNEVIDEITSLAGIPATALHISRAQFYSCLKLIAAYQASMPLRQELIAASMQLPLPRFSWKDSPSSIDTNAGSNIFNQQNGINVLPPPPVADRRNSLPRRADWQDSNTSGSRRNSVNQQHQQQQQQHLDAAANSDVPSTDSEVEQNESSCGGIGGAGISIPETNRNRGSPEAWSTNSDSPTPTNSVAERPWAKETLWHGLLGDEHRQLLGTEEESSDRHSSDDDNESGLETVYQITSEQREYYYKQFKAVQFDPNGLLSGQAARVFFEKSRIPVEELRHIWQLCDVTRDGALSLAEFTAAMHLVVLRRNNIPLPAMLPPCLYPSALQHSTLASQLTTQEPPEADLLHLNDDDDDDNTDNTIIGTNTVAVNSRIVNEKNVMNISTLSTSSQASTSSRQGISTINHSSLTPPPLPPIKNRSISNSPNVERSSSPPNLPTSTVVVKTKDRTLWTTEVPPNQWTKFTESPTSNVSSPGPKPVNFDMQRTAQAVVSDPQILHPVPLRVTPVAGALGTNTGDVLNNETYEGVALRDTSPKLLHSSVTNNVINSSNPASSIAASSIPQLRDSLQSTDLRAIQRPQAKKLPSKNIGALPPPPQRESSIGSTGTSNVICAGNSESDMSLSNGNPHQNSALNKKEPPPLPPPRPHRHGRSSSLDLNKFKMNVPSGQQPENEQISEQQQHSLPPQQTSSAASIQPVVALPPSRFSIQSNQRVSAFEVYRKPNTPRNSQSPTVTTQSAVDTIIAAAAAQLRHPSQPPPGAPAAPVAPVIAPFGSAGAAAIAQHAPQTITTLPNADQYEKRVNAISETLRHVSFKPDNNMGDILRHLREQNNLLLRLCNDLSDELLSVQTRKEEMRLKLEAATSDFTVAAVASALNTPMVAAQLTRTGSSSSAPVTVNVTGGSGSSGVHSNV